MTRNQEINLAIFELNEAIKNLRRAAQHCDVAWTEGGVHYNEVMELKADVDAMIEKLRRQRNGELS